MPGVRRAPAAAALQFPLRHPATANVVVGARSAAELRQAVAWFEQPIPDGLWRSLEDKGLIAAPRRCGQLPQPHEIAAMVTMAA